MTRRTFVVAALSATLLQTVGAEEAKVGVLLLAHGGRLQSWNDEINRIAAIVDRTYPTEAAFGMASKATIQAAIDRLTSRGIQRIIAVPLFVSSNSSVITSTEWLLGLRAEMPEDYKVFARMSHGHGSAIEAGGNAHAEHGSGNGPDLTPVKSSIPVQMTPALNRHSIVADILFDRARAISTKPSDEVVILVAHGPNPDDDNRKWLADLKALAELVRPRTSYHRIEYLTVRDDAPEPVRSQARAELRSLVEKATSEGKRALVVPVLLSYGGIEHGIRKRLEGLEFTMTPHGLLPDSRIAEWVLASVQATRQDR